MLILLIDLLIDLLKKIGGKKGKLLRFLHRVGLELEPAVYFSFLKTHKL